MPRLLLRLALAVTVLAAGAPVPAAAAAPRDVRLRGTAYEFNNSRVRLGGATVRVAELPRVRATTRADGTYTLRVPDRARVTPYIVADGYHTIYLQTFATAGEDLVNVNFQTPTEAVYRALAALLSAPVDAAGNLTSCAIVSTFSTRNVRGLDFEGFTAYGAHGVAGATARATPPLPPPVYFNADVIPDPTQPASSPDGGVVWSDVPTGAYRITASDPSTRFASFVATCAPGRVVNANPPWGLHELAPANPARLDARWSVRGANIALRSLRARRLPSGSSVRVACAGRACPFGARTFRPRSASFDIERALGSAAERIGAGQVLEVTVGGGVYNGTVVRWPIRAGARPAPRTGCVPLGNTRPRRRC